MLLALIGVAATTFRIVSTPTYHTKAFEVFEFCRGVEEVYLICKENESGYRVESILVMGDNHRVYSHGISQRKDTAYHQASASALYALQKYTREKE